MLTKAPTRQELVDKLYEVEAPYENYLDTLSQDKLFRIKQSVARRRHGLHSVAPTMCMGPAKCLFIEHCPIPPVTELGGPVMKNGVQDYGDINDYPIGRPCVMETFYMQQKVIDYVEHLQVNPENPVEMSIVNELALIDLYKNRALIILSKGDQKGQGQDFMKTDIISHDPETGQTSETTAIHPVAEMIDKLEKRREKWLDKLMETRKAKFDIASKTGSNKETNKIMEELQALRKKLESNSSNKQIEDAVEVVYLDVE